MLPNAIVCGVPEWRFWHCTPRILKAYAAAHKKWMDEQDVLAWMTGRYNFEAFSCVASNMFRSKGKSPAIYRDKPYSQERDETAKGELTDAEKKKYIDVLFHSLEIKQFNFNAEKRAKEAQE